MRLALTLAVLVAAAACNVPGAGQVAGSPTPSATPSSPEPTPSPVPAEEDPFVPGPNRPIPRDHGDLAEALATIEVELERGVRAWLLEGDPRTERAPRPLVLQALYQQRIYRLLVRRPRLAQRVYRTLHHPLERKARSLVSAGAKLRSLITPVEPPLDIRTGRPRPAGELWGYYSKAERRFDVAPAVLATVNMVETRFNRVRSSSSAGAQGPMQFLPSTWDQYGMGGDIYDPHDAILGAANYLSASGAPHDYRAALYAYNHADEYVDAVLAYARWMEREEHAYYVFYNWQAFAVTTEGDKQLTGPGKDV